MAIEKIRVLIADDHAVVREGLIRILQKQGDIEVVGEAENGIQAVEKTRALKPDVLLLDIAMPNINGLEVVGLVKKSVPTTAVVVLSMYDNETYIQQVLNAGARGYVLKASDTSEIYQAIRAARRGDFFLSGEINKRVITDYLKHPVAKPDIDHYEKLTAQEKQVFLLLVQGKSIKEIAEKLYVSPKTVEKHRTAISHKLGLKSRVEMTHYAIKNHIIRLELLKDEALPQK